MRDVTFWVMRGSRRRSIKNRIGMQGLKLTDHETNIEKSTLLNNFEAHEFNLVTPELHSFARKQSNLFLSHSFFPSRSFPALSLDVSLLLSISRPKSSLSTPLDLGLSKLLFHLQIVGTSRAAHSVSHSLPPSLSLIFVNFSLTPSFTVSHFLFSSSVHFLSVIVLLFSRTQFSLFTHDSFTLHVSPFLVIFLFTV